MEWTTKPPTQFGYYWWRLLSETQPEVVLIGEGGIFFRVGDGEEWSQEVEGGEWLGPLEIPQ